MDATRELPRRINYDEPIRFETLDDVLGIVWQKLTLGAEPKSSDYHIATIGTIEDGSPSVRSVVLRQALQGRRLVAFHTDNRSPKYKYLKSSPEVAWHFYSRRDKVQIRLRTHAALRSGDSFSRRVYDTMPARCQRVYLAPNAPGAISLEPTGNIPDDLIDRAPLPGEADQGFANFAVVDCTIESIDWLYLASSGHRRALYCWDGGRYVGSWVNP